MSTYCGELTPFFHKNGPFNPPWLRIIAALSAFYFTTPQELRLHITRGALKMHILFEKGTAALLAGLSLEDAIVPRGSTRTLNAPPFANGSGR